MSPLDVNAPRHYQGPAPAAWVCPACGSDQLGPLEAGCTACGAGKPGIKVEEPASTASTSTPTVPLSSSALDLPAFLRKGFEAWSRRSGHNDQETLHAFVAGYEFAMQQFGSARPKTEAQMTDAGITARTLAAALALFIEQVLMAQPEEIGTGEWVSVEQARELLQQLQRDGQR